MKMMGTNFIIPSVSALATSDPVEEKQQWEIEAPCSPYTSCLQTKALL
jgi:hypothetical protein